jgi:hypothetical protein
VSFYAELPNERLIYVVSYEYDPAMAQGEIPLPGKPDELSAQHQHDFLWCRGKVVSCVECVGRRCEVADRGAKVTASNTAPDDSPR